MDVKLQNAYVEVLLDNFMSVVKQNIMLQAQLEVVTKSGAELEEAKRRVDELQNENNNLKNSIASVSTERDSLKNEANQKNVFEESANNERQEKTRLQSALNDFMRKNKQAEDDINALKSALVATDKYIKSLESIAPVTKLNKLMKEFNIESRDGSESIKNGGSF